jgi:hypothetical protein
MTSQALVLGAAAAGFVMNGKMSVLEVHTTRVYAAEFFEGLGDYAYVVSSEAKIPNAQDKALVAAHVQMLPTCNSRLVLGVVKLQKLCTQCCKKQQLEMFGSSNSANSATGSCLFLVLGVWGICIEAPVSSPPGSVFERICSLSSNEEARAWHFISGGTGQVEVECQKQAAAQAPLIGFYTAEDAPRQIEASNNCGVIILLHGGLLLGDANYSQENARNGIRETLLKKQVNGFIGEIAVSEQTLSSLEPGNFLHSDVMDPALEVLQDKAPKSYAFLNGFFYSRIISPLATALANKDNSMTVSHLKVGRRWLLKSGFELTRQSVVISVVNYNKNHWIAIRLCFATNTVSVICGLGQLEPYHAEVSAVCRAMMALLYLEASHAPVWLQAKTWGIIRHYYYYYYGNDVAHFNLGVWHAQIAVPACYLLLMLLIAVSTTTISTTTTESTLLLRTTAAAKSTAVSKAKQPPLSQEVAKEEAQAKKCLVCQDVIKTEGDVLCAGCTAQSVADAEVEAAATTEAAPAAPATAGTAPATPAAVEAAATTTEVQEPDAAHSLKSPDPGPLVPVSVADAVVMAAAEVEAATTEAAPPDAAHSLKSPDPGPLVPAADAAVRCGMCETVAPPHTIFQ